MGKAIGMVEYLTVSTGVQAADMILKTAKVSIIEAKTVCPGKYIIIFSGDLSAVNSSIEASKSVHGEKLIDSFLLGIHMNLYSQQFMEQQKLRIRNHLEF